jgi:hypothetical protein
VIIYHPCAEISPHGNNHSHVNLLPHLIPLDMSHIFVICGVCRYEAVPYLTKETNAVVLVTRLKLIESLSLILQKGLSLLGIPTLERV